MAIPFSKKEVNSQACHNEEAARPSDPAFMPKQKDVLSSVSTSLSLDSLSSIDSTSSPSSSLSSSSSFASFFSEIQLHVDSYNGTLNSCSSSSSSSSSSSLPTTPSVSTNSKKEIKNEEVLGKFSCALYKDILLPGKLYISNDFLFFKTSVFGWKKLNITMSEILLVEKKTTAMVFPNAIEIITEDNKYFFGSFIYREKAYQLISRCISEKKRPILHGRKSSNTFSSKDKETEDPIESSFIPPSKLIHANTFPRTLESSSNLNTVTSQNSSNLHFSPFKESHRASSFHGRIERDEEFEQIDHKKQTKNVSSPSSSSSTSEIQNQASKSIDSNHLSTSLLQSTSSSPTIAPPNKTSTFVEKSPATSFSSSSSSCSSSSTFKSYKEERNDLSSNSEGPDTGGLNFDLNKQPRKHYPTRILEAYWPLNLLQAQDLVFQTCHGSTFDTKKTWNLAEKMNYSHWISTPWHHHYRCVQYMLTQSNILITVKVKETLLLDKKEKCVYHLQMHFPNLEKGDQFEVSVLVSFSLYQFSLVHVCVSAALLWTTSPSLVSQKNLEQSLFRFIKTQWKKLSKSIIKYMNASSKSSSSLNSSMISSSTSSSTPAFHVQWTLVWATLFLFFTFFWFAWLVSRLQMVLYELDTMYSSPSFLKLSVSQSLNQVHQLQAMIEKSKNKKSNSSFQEKKNLLVVEPS